MHIMLHQNIEQLNDIHINIKFIDVKLLRVTRTTLFRETEGLDVFDSS